MRTRLISYFLGVNESHLVKRPVKVSYDKYRCREVVLISTFKESKFKQEPITPGGTPHMKGVGMLVGNFELNP